MFVESLIKKFFQSCSARTEFTRMYDAFITLSVANDLLDYVKSVASTSNTIFWWVLQTQTEWVIFESARTHHLGLKAQNFENPIFTFWCFSLKEVYNSCKLQRLLQVAKFLLMYSFTHTNIVFLFRHLPTGIVIFINVCYQMKCCSGDSFYFFRSRFHVKFKQGIQRHILNSSTLETIYQVPRKLFSFVLNMMLFLIFLALPCAP